MKQREFILFISIQLLLTTQQQQQCPCIYTTLSNTLTVVNCSYFNLTKLPESLPSSSVIVDFSHNELKNVSLLNKLFENLSFLETFDLSYNSIEFMSDFLNSANSHELEHFDLSFNNLNKVFTASLAKLYHLKYYSIV
jgi:Leucine-rich repeat (LRR) protein